MPSVLGPRSLPRILSSISLHGPASARPGAGASASASAGKDEFIGSLERLSRGMSRLQGTGVLPKPAPSSGNAGEDLVAAVRNFADIFQPLIRALEAFQSRFPRS